MKNIVSLYLAALLSLSITGYCANPAATPAATVQKDQKAIADAQKKLADDSKAIADAQKEAQQAMANLQQVRAKAFQDIAAKLGIPKVQADLNAARAEADRLSGKSQAP